MMDVMIDERDIPKAPGQGAKKRNPESGSASSLGVETERVTITFPLASLQAIDAAAKVVGASRPWVLRALVRQLVEQGEIATDLGRVRVADYLS